MKFRRNGFLSCVMSIAIAIVAFNGASYGQFSVGISGPSATMYAPTGQFNVTATVSPSPAKIVFYRNDVPYKTFINPSSPQALQENQLGQDTYTYRARAYDSQGNWTDSTDIKFNVETPRVLRMGGGFVSPAPTPTGAPTPPTPTGPNRNYDHTQNIQTAVDYLRDLGGGTLYFPCSGGPNNDPYSIYNISGTIIVPSNVTLQGESAEEGIYPSRCRIYWTTNPVAGGCPNTLPTQAKAMFKVEGSKDRVRFRDLFMVSRILGHDCLTNGAWDKIRDQQTTAILLDAQTNGSISDIVFENVSITGFTYGIKAVGHSIADVKMRGVRPAENHRQLYINATYAYDWDVQNFNLSGMLANQGAVEIVNAGAPNPSPRENKTLKFLQLNCNGNFERTALFCVSIQKHGGLYFKGLHYEGSEQSLVVEDISGTNAELIILEGGATTGDFKDESMKLYLIGNHIGAAPDPLSALTQPHVDKTRTEFSGAGLQSTVVDCGDVHWDRTDVNGGTQTLWTDWKMSFTQTERNRGSLFLKGGDYSYVKPHTVCPRNDPILPDINKVGGEHFNTGVLPVDTIPVSTDPNKFGPCSTTPSVDCGQMLQDLLDSNTNRGTIYINGTVVVDQTITIPSGRQIVGTSAEAKLVLTDYCNDLYCITTDKLLQINVPVNARASGVVIRNLKLTTQIQNSTATGLAIVGGTNPSIPGTSSDMHFSGLTIENFNKGLEVTRFIPEDEKEAPGDHPMIDGVSLKNVKFVNNSIAASVFSSNVSNWNIMDLSMESNSAGTVGWHQTTSGTFMQNVTCRGGSASNKMEDCIKLDTASIYLTGLKQTQYVTNALTIGPNLNLGYPDPYWKLQFASIGLRNNDFRPAIPSGGASNVNITGKTFIMSMNNKYHNFTVSTGSEANLSRVTHCGDVYGIDRDGDYDVDEDDAYPGLLEEHPNLYVGAPTPIRVKCGSRPYPWDDPVKWGAEKYGTLVNDYYKDDQPLTGNFFDDVSEDLVIFRPDKLPNNPQQEQAQFRIRKLGAGAGQLPSASPTPIEIDWGLKGDIPMTGKFIPNQRSQIVVWRPSTGQWWMKDPDTGVNAAWGWGLSCSTVPYPDPNDPSITCDVPFIGNLIKDINPNGSEAYDMDEIAIYRPTNGQIWIYSPQFGQMVTFTRNTNDGSRIQVGDFRGVGHDQIAQIKNGTIWTVFDPRDPTLVLPQTGVTSPQSGDKPVAGNYLSGTCTQIAVWRPSAHLFIVKDPFTGCGIREKIIKWGSNNDSASTDYHHLDDTDHNPQNPIPTICPGGNCPDDVPLGLRVNTQQYGLIDRPLVYRPTKGAFKRSISNGQWWIHDPF